MFAVPYTPSHRNAIHEPNAVVNSQGPITAYGSTPLDVRAPHINLALSLPRPARVGRPFALDVHITSEVPRDLVVEDASLGSHRCPINAAARSGEHLIETEIDGGPWVKRFAPNRHPPVVTSSARGPTRPVTMASTRIGTRP